MFSDRIDGGMCRLISDTAIEQVRCAYSEVESDFGIFLVDLGKEAGFLIGCEFVGQCRGGGEG